MINITRTKQDTNRYSDKDGDYIEPGKIHYYNEYGYEIFPIIGETYNFMGKELIYPFNKK